MTLQIYLFSCVFLVSVGVRLSFDKFKSLLKLDQIFCEPFLKNRTLNIITSIGAILFGLLLILQGRGGDASSTYVPVVGDIIPALLGIIGGTALFLQTVNKRYEGGNKFLEIVQGFVQTNVAIIGVLMIIVAFIHAIFPEATLL